MHRFSVSGSEDRRRIPVGVLAAGLRLCGPSSSVSGKSVGSTSHQWISQQSLGRVVCNDGLKRCCSSPWLPSHREPAVWAIMAFRSWRTPSGCPDGNSKTTVLPSTTVASSAGTASIVRSEASRVSSRMESLKSTVICGGGVGALLRHE